MNEDRPTIKDMPDVVYANMIVGEKFYKVTLKPIKLEEITKDEYYCKKEECERNRDE